MTKLRFPYPGVVQEDFSITQGYDSNPKNPATGGYFYAQHHGGMDIVPLQGKYGNFWNAPIYPVLDGKTLSASTVDKDRGLGIKVRSVLEPDLIAYFRRLGCIPADYHGEVWMDHLYWHMLKVVDLDGWVDELHPVGLTGNSGYVFAGGLPVPSSEKNVPPYPGGHLHFEYALRSPTQIFNLNKDAIGRLPPDLLFAFTGQFMPQIKTQAKGPSRRIILEAADLAEWAVLCKVYGFDPNHVDETVN